MPSKILGREPAVFFALAASVLLAVIQFVNVPDQISGALNAAVLAGAGFATAAMVSAERALPALTGLVQAVFAVFLAYGSPLSESTQTGILALIAAVGAYFVRQNVLAPLDADGFDPAAGRDAAYENGYQAGQDEMTRQDSEALAVVRPQEGGAHGHTEVMPSVGDIYESDDKGQR
jgi:uncharacterized transporter YbjL